tara:strand:- start:512 stop:2215 length:1704 start_codon:yes stop_codon:yes gene_type:complete
MSKQEYLDCYIRVSSKSQLDTQSLNVQEQIGRKVSKKLNLKFRLRNEKSRSSTIHHRDVLEELMSDIEKGTVKNIWCSERSRMFRDEVDSSLFRRNYLQKYNVRLFEGSEGNQCNFDNLEEKLSYDIVSKIQQYENEKRSLKSKQGKRYLLSKQLKNRHYGGSVQFGYRVVDKYLEIDEYESKWVLFMFNSILDGKSVIDIKKELDRSGVKTTRTKSGLWSLGTIQKILKNESYTGVKTFYDKELDKTFEYRIDSIVSVNKFRQVSKELNKRLKNKDNNKKHFSIFDDIDFKCECNQSVGSIVKKGVRKNGKKFNTRIYYCMTKLRNWSRTDSKKVLCDNYKSMNMDDTDNTIIDIVKDTVSQSNVLKEKFKNEVLKTKKEKNKNIEEETKKLEKKHKTIVRSIERTYESLVSLETDLMLEKKDKRLVKGIINNLYKELDHQKKSLQQTEQDIDDQINKKDWLEWTEKFSENLDVRTQDKQSRKDFITGLVNKIVVRSEYQKDRDEKDVQTGHLFDIHFKMKVVNDKLIYEDESNKSLGYEIKEGRDKLTTQSFKLRKSRGTVKKKE